MDGEKREQMAGCSSAWEEGENTCNDSDSPREQEEEATAEGTNGEVSVGEFTPGPLVPLKHHLEKDKNDESLRRWKEKLLGCDDGDIIGQIEPEVTFHSIAIICDEMGEFSTSLPLEESQSKKVLFALREGSQYRLKITFSVKHNIVSGLAYFNTVWRAGVQVDQSEGMLGTFAPQQHPYVHLFEEETTPAGMLARGVYLAKLRFEDDDKKCHMELCYSFEIKKSS